MRAIADQAAAAYREACERKQKDKDMASKKKAHPKPVKKPEESPGDALTRLRAAWSREQQKLAKKRGPKWPRTDAEFAAVYELPAFRSIVRLGFSVVPLLLSDSQVAGTDWSEALGRITGICQPGQTLPGNPLGGWLTWGTKHGFLKPRSPTLKEVRAKRKAPLLVRPELLRDKFPRQETPSTTEPGPQPPVIVPGSLVRLKSGGPAMTVERTVVSFEDPKTDTANCVWMANESSSIAVTNAPSRDTFPVFCLDIVPTNVASTH